MERPIVNYPTSEARFGSVVSVTGRDFVVVPYESTVYIPKEIVDADSKHPERGMLNYHIECDVERLLLDIMEYQRDALAATVVKVEPTDERVVAYRVVIPALMPVDTRDRWAVKSDTDRKDYEERLQKAMVDRKVDMSTSRSYRMVEWQGNSQPDSSEQRSVWHPKTERPNDESEIMIDEGDGCGTAGTYYADGDMLAAAADGIAADWEDWRMDRWAYISDLVPKKEKKGV